MTSIFPEMLDWSEVWALLIPLSILLVRPNQPRFLKPVIIYLVLALIIDSLIDVGWKFKEVVPDWMHPNNWLYNLHSIIRFICFSWFFYLLGKPFAGKWHRILSILAALFVVINFSFFESFFKRESFSSRLLAVESGFLLFFCLQYYLQKLQDDTTTSKKTADYWVVLGFSIYVVFNFFYFLFYTTLLENGYIDFVERMWTYHNISFIILCIFIARALYVSRHN